MGIFNFFSGRKKENSIKSFKPLIDVISPKQKEEGKKELTHYVYKRVDGEFIFNLGDKVICRSNEPDPLLVGELVSLWDNEGKWESPIPYIKDDNGEIWGIMGVMRPYSDDLYNQLIKMSPLEQWNYFVPKEYRYSEQDILKKEESYNRRKKSLDKIFKK